MTPLLLLLAGCATNLHDPVFGVALERWVVPPDDSGVTKTDTSAATADATGTATATATEPAVDTGSATRTATGTSTDTGDPGLGGGNRPPDLPDVRLEPATPHSGDTLTVVAVSQDPDGDAITYTATWSRNGQPLRTPGDTIPGARVQRGDVWAVTIVATDGVYATEPVTVATTIGNAPPAATVSVSPTAPGPDEDVVARARGTDAEGDPVTLRYAWTRDGLVTPVEGPTLPAAETTQGQIWTVRATPSDPTVEGAAATASVTIRNHLPTVGRVTLDPAAPRAGDALVASADDLDDLDGDDVVIRWSFYVDDTLVQDGASDTLPPGIAGRDQLIHVVATPDDGFETGRSRSSSPVLVRNTPPVGGGVAVLPGDGSRVLRRTTGATCSPDGWSDPDGDPERWTFGWTRNGVRQPEVQGTVATGGWARGDVVRCTATPRDAIEAGVPLTSEAATVGNTPPTVQGAALSTRTPSAGETLAVTLAGLSDDDGDPVTPGWAWFVDGVQRGTGPTFATDGLRRGQRVRVRVTPWDGQDAGDAVDSDEAVIANAAPRIRAVTIAPSTATTNTVLRAEVLAEDPDADGLTLGYAWSVDGVAVPDADGATLEGAVAFDKGATVTVAVTARDPEGAQDGPVASDAVLVADSPPTAPDVRVTPTRPRAGVDALVCGVAGGGTDADSGDTVTRTTQWYLNSVATGRNDPTVPAADLVAGQVWTCRVQVRSSGGGTVEASRSAIVQ